ncbi:MAG: cytochrome P450, partial [Vicinamibacterales bacterium]
MNTPHDPAHIPQPRVRPIVGNGPDLDADAPVQSMVKLAQELGPIYRLTFPTGSLLILSSLEFANELGDDTRFEKKVSGALTQLRDFVGDGLFTAHTREPNWGKAHRLLMPAFGPHSMRNYFDDMLDIADQMLTKWERMGQEADFDVSDNMTRLTLDTIALCGFNYRFNSFYQNEPHPVVEAMVRALSEAGNRSRRLPIQNQLMVRTQRQYEADGAYMHSVSNDLIVKRRKLAEDEAPRDLLQLMMKGKDSLTGEGLDDVNIRNQMLTFLVAGHETTSGLLTFAIHMLLEHPDILRKAQEEVDRVLGDETPRQEHIAKLIYIDQILRETLRLWPTAPAFVMTPKHDTMLAGRYPVKARDVLLLLLPALHRDPKVWDDPHKFDPERWAPGKREKIPPHAWKPFGSGERACIGRAFALQEATLVLGMLLQRFEIWLPQPYKLIVKASLTM